MEWKRKIEHQSFFVVTFSLISSKAAEVVTVAGGTVGSGNQIFQQTFDDVDGYQLFPIVRDGVVGAGSGYVSTLGLTTSGLIGISSNQAARIASPLALASDTIFAAAATTGGAAFAFRFGLDTGHQAVNPNLEFDLGQNCRYCLSLAVQT